MNTLDELKYYCNEDNFVGALMLSGEWGSGKTYLVDNILKSELEDTHVIIRISLFGFDSIEEVHTEIKKIWFQAYCELNEPVHGMSEKVGMFATNFKKFIKNFNSFIPESAKTKLNKLVAINILDFVEVKNRMDSKKVILVFDDLERTNFSTNQLLGCINHYCENLHINTIVIANENKIKTDQNIYKEIKEKTIQRTILYRPDYSEIISSIIQNFNTTKSESYSTFLKENIKQVTSLFSELVPDETKESQLFDSLFDNSENSSNENKKILVKPQNIRSLKCAVSDFERIYILLVEKNFENLDKYFFAFISYAICLKSGQIEEVENEDEIISNTYFGFYDKNYIIQGIKKWIKTGEWNSNEIDEELELIIAREKAITSKEKIRTYDIFQLEEKDIKDGFDDFLQDAYEGNLDLNDYVNLICNSSRAHQYKITIPDINWNSINMGIEKRIEEAFESKESKPYLKYLIDDSHKNEYTDDEWKAYEKIYEFYESNELEYSNKRDNYISFMNNDPEHALINILYTFFDVFNKEMANATANGFEKISNKDKQNFVEDFNRFWRVGFLEDYRNNFNYQSSLDGFNVLKENIELYRDKCNAQSQTISAAHATNFIKNIEWIISQLERMNDKNS